MSLWRILVALIVRNVIIKIKYQSQSLFNQNDTMSDNKYWTDLADLHQTPEFVEKAGNEFSGEVPMGDVLGDDNAQGGRRDFLKMMGFSITAAAIASSCKIPVKKSIPYVFNPDEAAPNFVPGIAKYFASTYADSAGVVNVLVKTREGRPIKIEGNPESPLTKGGTNARAQASVLGLYDISRLQGPVKDGDSVSWAQADKEISNKLSEIAQSGGKIVILSNSLSSPVATKAIAKFKAKYPTAEQVSYDPVSLYAMRAANAISAGGPAIPAYNFEKADVIVGFNCDFLGTWLSPVEFTKQYRTNRVPTKDNPVMSRHYQFQSAMTITGATADYKVPMKPSEEKAALAALLSAVGGPSVAGVGSFADNASVAKVAKDLMASRGKSLVVSGTNDVEVQLLVNALNAQLGNYGNTIGAGRNYKVKEGSDEALAKLADDLKNNKVAALILYNANPVYNTAFGEVFKAALPKLQLAVALNDRADESASLCKYICPDSHYLESWNIIEPKTGFYGFVQPAIQTIFDTRQAVESLLIWSEGAGSAYDLAKSIATEIGANWEQAVELGFYEDATPGSVSASLATATAAVKGGVTTPKGMELLLVEPVLTGDGSLANNPFLQETPDPVYKVTWDNFVSVPYTFAMEQGIDPKNPVKEVPVARISVNGKSVELPVVVGFGQAQNTLVIGVGYGREKAGVAGSGVGQNVYPFLKSKSTTTGYSLDGATFELTGKKTPLAITQSYPSLQEEVSLPGKKAQYRSGIVKEANLKQYAEKENAGNEDREFIKHHLLSLYDPFEYQGHHWGMAVELNACTGCGACVVACSVENNVPVVGKREVYRGHEMHWMRIDRYYSGNPDNPDVTFQPMMCQHCDNAPCENVCPVNATNHSSEGLNQMAYNRCIGTRYCANNCPYKVRRFNWLDYQGNDSFGKRNDPQGAAYMFEDLTRMVLNPDVTVRTRGVIEKCSFCVQRIQDGKLTAKTENRTLRDNDIRTACQTACPADAIAFGDINDKNSAVHKAFFENARNYYIFEELHFLPSVGYQVKIRNKDEAPANKFI
jgi:MoCo/4Fe-4S cofactor protein with predicted Tat translocation signal